MSYRVPVAIYAPLWDWVTPTNAIHEAEVVRESREGCEVINYTCKDTWVESLQKCVLGHKSEGEGYNDSVLKFVQCRVG